MLLKIRMENWDNSVIIKILEQDLIVREFLNSNKNSEYTYDNLSIKSISGPGFYNHNDSDCGFDRFDVLYLRGSSINEDDKIIDIKCENKKAALDLMKKIDCALNELINKILGYEHEYNKIIYEYGG